MSSTYCVRSWRAICLRYLSSCLKIGSVVLLLWLVENRPFALLRQHFTTVVVIHDVTSLDESTPVIGYYTTSNKRCTTCCRPNSTTLICCTSSQHLNTAEMFWCGLARAWFSQEQGLISLICFTACQQLIFCTANQLLAAPVCCRPNQFLVLYWFVAQHVNNWFSIQQSSCWQRQELICCTAN